jgi:hypothetical protein
LCKYRFGYIASFPGSVYVSVITNGKPIMSVERRTRSDRRQRDSGPPRGSIERRRHAERRLPTAAEAEISAADFEKYFGSVARATNNNDYLLDQAADVFDRVRDGY